MLEDAQRVLLDQFVLAQLAAEAAQGTPGTWVAQAASPKGVTEDRAARTPFCETTSYQSSAGLGVCNCAALRQKRLKVGSAPRMFTDASDHLSIHVLLISFTNQADNSIHT